MRFEVAFTLLLHLNFSLNDTVHREIDLVPREIGFHLACQSGATTQCKLWDSPPSVSCRTAAAAAPARCSAWCASGCTWPTQPSS